MTNMQPYSAPKTLTVELPGHLGSLNIRPRTSANIQVWADAILIEPNVYQVKGSMMRHENLWYFLNKLEIGVPGQRPSPKKQEKVATVIAGYINGRLKNDPEFSAALEELRVQEEIRREQQQRDALRAEYQNLKRNVERDLQDIQSLRLRLDEYEQVYQKSVQALRVFEEQNPELVQPQTLVEVIP